MRLPIYPGTAYAGTPHAEKVWYILEDASTPGAADDLGVNYAPKLANMAISCPACVQTAHLVNLPPSQNHFGPAPPILPGTELSPHSHRRPGTRRLPLARFQPGAVAGPGYTPFIRISGLDTIYTRRSSPLATAPTTWSTTPTLPTGLASTSARPQRTGRPAPFQSWVDMLFVKGFYSASRSFTCRPMPSR